MSCLDQYPAENAIKNRRQALSTFENDVAREGDVQGLPVLMNVIGMVACALNQRVRTQGRVEGSKRCVERFVGVLPSQCKVQCPHALHNL
jgi:hypothetical protein